ncbi:MAG TPA: PPC domain-containing protein [bacterium]|nr:PPC domain-containing protein [bacterium]HOM26195.1 PPC domain-containing protein [bacterium]
MNKRSIFLIFLISCNFIFAQIMTNQPSIGYVYQAGGQRGTTLEIIVGGQNIRGARNAYFSTDKIKVLQVNPLPSLNPQQKRLLAKNLREIITNMYRKEYRKPEIVYEMDGVKLPKHPLLENLENKSFEELRFIAETFLGPFRTEQIKRSIQEKVMIKVEISPDTEPGIYELRVQSPLGLTNFLNFYVSEYKEVKEKEKIPYYTIFDPLKEVFDIPLIINGQITPGDVDRFYFNAKKGQKLVIELKGREIIPFMADAVPGWFQGVLTLYDSSGREIAYADDYYFNPDPVIFYEVKKDGEYMIEVRDALYRGREDFVYRLFIGEKPFITHIFPPGGERYEKTIVSIYGWNLPQKTVELDTEDIGIHRKSFDFNGIYSNQIYYMVDEIPEINEREPNDSLKNAMQIIMPQIVNGTISKSGDIDIYKFKCSKGDKIVAEVYSRRLNFPLDSIITLMDSSGKVLISNDDYFDKSFDTITHHADSYIYYEIPDDGIYYFKITDVKGHGGDEYIYRLRIEKSKPDFKIFIVPSAINITSNNTVPFYIYAVRKDGFDGEIEVSLKDCPEGLILSGNKIPKGKDKICMTITADTNFNFLNKPVRIKIEGTVNINGKLIKREAIPADEMMQAFAYYHLLPSSELLFYPGRSRFFKSQPISLNEKFIKIPSGGSVKIEGKISGYSENEKITLELKDPPDGITIEDLKIENDTVSFRIKAEPKIKKGFSDNLIIEVFSEPKEETSQKKQRSSKGFLPALMFEII